jgi:hypothetical protein
MLTKEVHQIKSMISFKTSRGRSHDPCHPADQSELAAEGRCNRFYKITTSSLFLDFQLHRTDSLVGVVQSDRRESDGLKKKSTRLIFNLKWIYFYKNKGQDVPFELGIQA